MTEAAGPPIDAAARRAGLMGMFLFLGSEMMLFGGLFAAVLAYRVLHPQAAQAAAEHLKLWLATANTAILLTSSLFVALGVHAARQDDRRGLRAWFGVAIGLGLAFLSLKGLEYGLDYREGLFPGLGPIAQVRQGPSALFIDLYLVGTALHSLHMLIGLGVLTWFAVAALRRTPLQALPVEAGGLYWHFVDVVWVFLFPVFYLARG